MATNVFTGAVDTDWAETGNWSLGAIPVDGDDVEVDPDSPKSLLLNLDRTGDTALAGLHLSSFRTYAGGDGVTVGSSASPLMLTADEVRLEGAGAHYYQVATGTAGNDTGRLILRSANVTDALTLTTDGTQSVDSLELIAGRAVSNPTSGTPQIADHTLIAPEGGDESLRFNFGDRAVMGVLDMSGGIGVISGNFSDGTLSGGVLTVEDGVIINTFTRLHVSAGRVNLDPKTGSTPNPVLIATGGVVDLAYNKQANKRYDRIWYGRGALIITNPAFDDGSIIQSLTGGAIRRIGG